MEIKKPDDLMFNGYEDSVEDEKANQEAFERALHFSDETKEDRLRKISFLNSRTQDDPEEEFSLVKAPVKLIQSPKIEIDSHFMQLDKPNEEISPIHKVDEEGDKSILGKFFKIQIEV